MPSRIGLRSEKPVRKNGQKCNWHQVPMQLQSLLEDLAFWGMQGGMLCWSRL